MNNKEDWTSMEKNMQTILDQIREEYPDFWMDEPGLAEDTKTIPTQCQEEREKREAKRLRRHRRRVIAAGFIAVILIGIGTGIFLNSDTAHAMKFAMEKKYYQAKGWVQATDPDRVDDENVITVLVTDEAEVPKYKSFWKELIVPQYIPMGYTFKELYVEKYVHGLTSAVYTYQDNNPSSLEKIHVAIRNNAFEYNTQLWLQSNDIFNGERKYNIWKDESTGMKGMDVIVDNTIISICGNIEIEELVAIINSMQPI
ncbi:MAG: DUF4367 domain-containing protein [Firmicutes bacterium]|nr:DUF4367 domain-containing protein [Bacillota bacterium]